MPLVAWPATLAGSLGREHAAPESTLALVKAASLACGRSRPLAWCSRPMKRATSPARPLRCPPVKWKGPALALLGAAAVAGIVIGFTLGGGSDKTLTSPSTGRAAGTTSTGGRSQV